MTVCKVSFLEICWTVLNHLFHYNLPSIKRPPPKSYLQFVPIFSNVSTHLDEYVSSFIGSKTIQNRLKNSKLLSTAPYQNIICQVFNGVVSSLHLDKIPVFFDGKNCSIYLVCKVYDHIYTKNGVAKKSYHKIQKRYHLSAYIVWSNGCIYWMDVENHHLRNT